MPADAPDSIDHLLRRMVQFDTVNGAITGKPQAEEPLAAWLCEVARSWGLAARRLPLKLTDAKRREIGDACPPAADQLLIIVPASQPGGAAPRAPFAKPTDGSPWAFLLFDSHLDTVAVEGMTIAPFSGEIHGDKLLGRGACDTKGTGAAMLWALKQYAGLQDRPNHVALLFSTDEEYNMTGIASFLAHDLPALTTALGRQPAGVIVGEPTFLKPVIAHNGVARYRVTTHGVAAHSSVPMLGKSAIRMMGTIMQAIEDSYLARLDVGHPLTGGAVGTITTIRGGSQVNIVPDRCVIEIDRRLAPGEKAEAELATLRQVVAAACTAAGQDEIKATVELYRDAPPLTEQVNAGFLPAVQRVLKSHNLPPQPIGAPFATNAGDLAAAGLPAIVIGPGDPYPAHTKDEWVSLSAIRQGADVYLSLMQAAI